MTDNSDEYRPYFEIDFDFSTSLSKDDAVLAMLGWIKKPFREISEAEWDFDHRVNCGESVTEEEEIRFDSPLPSLFEILRSIKESADADYSNAKYEPLSDDVVQEKLAGIKQSHLLFETAYKFYCYVDDELAKGEQSALRIDRAKTTNPETPYITLASLDEWAKNKFEIDIFPESVRFKDLNLSQQEIEEAMTGGLNSGAPANLQITFALLVEAFTKIGNTYQHSNGEPNRNTIKKEIRKIISKNEEFTGQSERTIDSYIKAALEIKNKTPPHSLKTKPKLSSLEITLALLVEAFANKKQDFANESGEPDIAKIAEHLANDADELPGQGPQAIKQRLKNALEVRKNPDKRKL